MSRIIAMAHSYYMLLVLAQLRITEYMNDSMDIILTDDSRDSSQVMEKLKASCVFDKCYYMMHEGRNGEKKLIKNIGYTH